jgi:DNA-binding MarR family transcriptional regulator
MLAKAKNYAASDSTIHLLHRASQCAEDMFAKSIGDVGLTARQFIVLSLVAGHEDPSQTFICEKSGIDRSTLADIVRRLVARGLLSRRRTRHDARMYAIKLTEEGEQSLAKAIPVARDVDNAILKFLNASQRDDFTASLQRLADSITFAEAA